MLVTLGPSRRHCRVLSPQREASPSSIHRFESPFRGDGAEFDEVNLSGFEDDDTRSSSPRSEENAGRTDSEGLAGAEAASSARRSMQFPLPMAVPVAVTRRRFLALQSVRDHPSVSVGVW